MSVVRFILLGGLFWSLSTTAFGQEAVSWLQRMNVAARNLNYAGVFMYQTASRTELSRITHFVDATGEHEKLETLDGTPREVLRKNDEVQCFLPADKVVVIDRASSGRFPGALATKATALGEYYNVRLGAVVRVAGRDTQTVLLEPRDDMRYGHQFWADRTTGLLLKARMVDDRGQVIEQFAFTEIMQSIPFERERIKPRTVVGDAWQVLDARGSELRVDELPWTLRGLPIGYRPVSLNKRVMRKDGHDTLHLTLTDGLANISVFIEPQPPTAAAPEPGVSVAGATHILRRVVSNHLVTVLGEVPEAAIRRVADGVEPKKK
mgnify:CR=1 FL=1